MQDSDVMSNLFSRINELQNKKKELENKKYEIDRKTRELKYKKCYPLWQNEGTQKQFDKFNQEDIKIKGIYNNLIQKNVKINAVEHIFQFIPQDSSNGNVYISGDFNKWGMTEMKRDFDNDKLFTYKEYLIKGYEYAYIHETHRLRLCYRPHRRGYRRDELPRS